MSRKIRTLGLVALMIFIGGTVFAQIIVTLDQAIGYGISEIERLAPGAKVMVLNFKSPSERLSNYVLDEMTTMLTRNGRLTVVDRAGVEFVLWELNYKSSGDISDEAALSIGRIVGAQYIISGTIEELSNNYLVQIKTMPVESAAFQTLTQIGVVKSAQIANLIGAEAPGLEASDTSTLTAADISYVREAGTSSLKNRFVLSAGTGVYGKFEFDHYSEGGKPRLDTAMAFVVPLFLDIELFSYLLLELSPYYQNRLIFEERVNIIGAAFSLFGQYPIQLTDRVMLYQLFGFGYDMSFYMWNEDYNTTRKGKYRDDGISNYLDFLYLKPGIRLNFNITDNLRLDARFIWDFVLYNRLLNEINNTFYAPSLFLGLNYLFLRL